MTELKALHEVPLESLSEADKQIAQRLFLAWLAQCELRDYYKAQQCKEYVMANRSPDWRLNQKMFKDKWEELSS